MHFDHEKRPCQNPFADAARLVPVLAVCWALVVAEKSAAQALDLSITDPDEIGAICGGDRSIGEALFVENCAQCHQIDDGAQANVGPGLLALFGRPVAAQPGYGYSPALQLLGAGGMIWERETLNGYLADPKGFAPGGSMNFPGIADQETRQHLMTYLRVVTQPPPPASGSVVVPDEVLAIEGDVAWGEYLAAECVGCHKVDGTDAGIPKITGWPHKPFMTAMYEYRLRARPNTTMQLVAERLSDEELAALSAYFSTLQ